MRKPSPARPRCNLWVNHAILAGSAGRRYRQRLFGTAAGPREHGGTIALEELQRVLKTGGQLPLATVLRCRVRYFTDGAVLGSQAFVAMQLARYRKRAGPCAHTAPRPLPGLTDWGDLATMRKLRGPVFT